MSFYIRKSGKNGWILANDYYENGKRKAKAVPRESYHSFGFSRDMTIDQARERVRRLNKENWNEKVKMVRAANRLKEERISESIYIPQELAEPFQEWLIENHLGSEKHRKKILSHWRKVQELVMETELLPHKFHKNKGKIYNYFINRGYSLDYTKKILRILNQWGEFVCQHQGQFYKPVPKLSRTESQRLHDSNTEAEHYVGPSEKLTPELLESIKDNLKPEQYRWLFISVWFGLRPKEIDSLKNKLNGGRIEKDDDLGVPVLWVYQSKLIAVNKSNRWKGIPAFTGEQRLALDYIEQGDFQKPLTKTIKKYTYEQITLYGGRKGFTDLMLSLGQKLEDISAWLGHQSIEMTWKRYRNKKRVNFTEVKERKNLKVV